MQRNVDVGHLTDLLNGIISFGKINMHARGDGRTGWRKIFIIAAKSGNNRSPIECPGERRTSIPSRILSSP